MRSEAPPAPESTAQDEKAPAEPVAAAGAVETSGDEAAGEEASKEAGVAPEPTTQE